MKRIWGIRSGLIGDTIMALPSLCYLKRKYPKSYITWVIQGKCSQAAPLYLNHPLIDRIYITEGWEYRTENDERIKSNHDIIINETPPVIDPLWYNKINCVECVANMAGIDDIFSVIDEVESQPTLVKWWVDPDEQNDPRNHGYSTIHHKIDSRDNFKIGIFPFAKYASQENRSPTLEWWSAVCSMLKAEGYSIEHFGWITEPNISGVETKNVNLSFFEQIKKALTCDLVIGTDSGSMWVLGAFKIPSIYIMTYHMAGHNENPNALKPINVNGTMLFNPKNCNMVKPIDVIDKVKEYEENLSK